MNNADALPGRSFLEWDRERLFGLLVNSGLLPEERAEALVHALVDIGESISKIYGEQLPALLACRPGDAEAIQDKLWDLREEFRHVDYHIHDADFLTL